MDRRRAALVTMMSGGVVDTTAPTVTGFAATTPTPNLAVPITTFTASEAGVSYLVTETSDQPAAGAAGWSASVPTTYATTEGAHTLYPWVKDAVGNVSSVYDSPVAVVVGYAQVVLSYAPDGYWPLTDAAGQTVAAEATANLVNAAYNAADIPGTSTFQNGNLCPTFVAADGDRVNVYSAALNTLFNKALFTIAVWVKVRAASVWTDNAARFIVNLRSSGTNWIRITKKTTNKLECAYIAGGATVAETSITTTSEDWFLLVMEVNRAGETMKSWLNNSLVSTKANTANWTGDFASDRCVIANDQTEPSGLSWDGYIAHLAFWNRTLSDAERLGLYTTGGPNSINLYVATTGNDTTGDGTEGNPYLTINKAQDISLTNWHVREIIIAAGTYTEQVNVRRRNLTFRSSGGTAVIDGETSRKAIYNPIHQGLTLIGPFEFINCTNGLESYGNNLTASYLTVHSCSNYGVFVSACDGVTLSNIEAYGCTLRGVYADIGVTDFVCSNLYSHDHYCGIEIERDCDDALVVDSWATACDEPFVAKTSQRVKFLRCVAWNNTGNGFYIKGAEDNEIENCVSYSNGLTAGNGIFAHQDDVSLRCSNGLSIKNSIISETGQYGIRVEDACQEGFVSDYNDIQGNTVGVGLWGVTACGSLADWRTASSQDAHSLAVDPDYATTVKDGFVPQAASVLVGADDGGPQGHTG